MDIYLKSEGQYVKKELSQEDYLNWFKSNMDEEGNVTEDCMLYKDADLEVNTDKSVTFVMSDDSLDRDFERFDTTGWDLKAFKKNPVLLWSHDRKIPAIGLMEKVRIKDTRLIGNPVFDADDPLAMKISGKVQKRIIRAGSVGFFPNKIEFIDDEKDPCRLIYKKQELREFSLCNVPANQNAVVIEDGKSANYVQVGEPKTYSTGHYKWEYTKEFYEQTEKVLQRIAGMEIDIENLKDMQIKMAGKIAKEDRNYYEELLKTKKSQPKDSKKSLTETILKQ